MNGFPIKFFSLILALVLCLSGCSSSDESSGNVDASATGAIADGYEIKTDENGYAKIVGPDGNIIADSANGDDITITDDGVIIINNSNGNTVIINNDGTTVVTDASGITTGGATENDNSSSRVSVTESQNENVVATAGNKVSGAGTTITLKGATAEISGSGAKLDGSDIVISKAGTYLVTGKLNNGRIVVAAGSGKVAVILNGADIACNYSSAFYVKKAGLVTLTANEGSTNLLKDAASYDYTDSYSSYSDKTPDACIYSDNELILNGAGRLLVRGNSQNGITGKEALSIEKVNLTVSAVGHGITGKEKLYLSSVQFSVTSGKDGLRSNATANASLGTVSLLDSKGSIVSGEDGVQAETTLTVESGSYFLQSGGGSGDPPSSEISAKGLKGASAVNIKGGTISADCLDDALHSNGSIGISGGNLILKSGDDGIHADNDVDVSGGTIVVSQSYEGIEATNVTISGGNAKVTASDDGVNISGGDGSGEMGRPGMDHFGSSGGKLIVSAGMLSVNSEGDGLDANGNIEISGGTVIVNGPTRGGNGVLDYDGECIVTGGRLIAVGSSDMAQTPSLSSTQNCLVYTNFSNGAAGTLFNIQASDGTELITYRSAKSYNWICYSSKDIKTGESYIGYVGGSHTGSNKGGIYSGGSYTAGSKVDELTVSSVVTSNGPTDQKGGAMGGPHGGMGKQRRSIRTRLK